jgi:D-glycero-D-manno-heptose 1,7-bisphosphate phosphatase
VFLDRDGTLVEDSGYLRLASQLAVYPWTVDAVRALNRAHLPVVVITNQSGVARGFFTEAEVHDVHGHLSSVVEAGGARIDAYYYCPHHPEGTVKAYAQRCNCRKPGRALVDRAASDLGLDPTRSFVVGDKWLDVRLARAIGARALMVRTGYGEAEESQPPPDLAADAIADNLIEAVGWILRHHRPSISNQQSAVDNS